MLVLLYLVLSIFTSEAVAASNFDSTAAPSVGEKRIREQKLHHWVNYMGTIRTGHMVSLNLGGGNENWDVAKFGDLEDESYKRQTLRFFLDYNYNLSSFYELSLYLSHL